MQLVKHNITLDNFSRGGASNIAGNNGFTMLCASGRYAWTGADNTRNIDIGALSDTVRGQFDSHDFGARGELAINAFETSDVRSVRIQPLAAFEWSHLTREGFQETSAAGLDDLGTRGIPVHLVYGTSYWDPHTGDFVKIRDDLKPMRHDSITAEILGAGQTPIYIVNEANHASCKIARAAGYQEVERIGVLE